MTHADRMTRGRANYTAHLTRVGTVCTIQRQALVGKVSSGPYITVADGTDIPCLIQQAGGSALGMVITALTTGTVKIAGPQGLALPYDAPIKPGDSVLIGNNRYSVKSGDSVRQYMGGLGLIADIEWMKVEQT